MASRFSRLFVAYELLVLISEVAKFFLRWTDWEDWPDLIVFDVEEGTGMVRHFVLQAVLSWVGLGVGIVEVDVRTGGMRAGDGFTAGSGGGEVVEEGGEEGSVVELEVGAGVGIFGVAVGVFGVGVEIRGDEVELLDVRVGVLMV